MATCGADGRATSEYRHISAKRAGVFEQNYTYESQTSISTSVANGANQKKQGIL